MNKKVLLPLALVSIAALASGCATQKTRSGSTTNILGGLVTIERGAYQPAPAATLEINTNQVYGDAGKPSDTQVRIGWGAITATDY